MESWTELDKDVVDLFETGIRPRLADGETTEDAISLGFALGAERASNVGRPFTVFDMELALSGLCWWPLKPPPTEANEEVARTTRADLLETLRSGSHLDGGWSRSIGSSSGAQLVETLLFAPTDSVITYFLERGEGTGLVT